MADSGEIAAVDNGPFRFVPKLQPVEAMRWTGDNWDEVSRWVYGEVIDVPEDDYDGDTYPVAHDGQYLSVLEPEVGEANAGPDDWLIKTDKGWFVGDLTFEETYARRAALSTSSEQVTK